MFALFDDEFQRGLAALRGTAAPNAHMDLDGFACLSTDLWRTGHGFLSRRCGQPRAQP